MLLTSIKSFFQLPIRMIRFQKMVMASVYYFFSMFQLYVACFFFTYRACTMVLLGNVFSSGSISCTTWSSEVKLLSLHPYLTLTLTRLNTTKNSVNDFLHPKYEGFFESLSNVSYIGTCAYWKDSCPRLQIISSKRSPISTSNGSDWDPLYMSVNSPCHIHVI